MKVDSLSDRQMELKDVAQVQGQWGDEEARDQSAGGT
jgi:hypothetical protein